MSNSRPYSLACLTLYLAACASNKAPAPPAPTPSNALPPAAADNPPSPAAGAPPPKTATAPSDDVAAAKPAPAAPKPAAAATKPAPPAAAATKPVTPKPAAAAAAATAAPKSPVAGAPGPAAATLNLTDLEQRLRDTKAVGVFTKLSLKNQVDDLLGDFRNLYKGPTKQPPSEFRQRYDALLGKVLGLLQRGDPQLAQAIAASREAIWGILSDPEKFAKI